MFPFRRNRKPTEGAAARVKAEVALKKTKAQTPMFKDLSDSLKELQKENHLAQGFKRLIQEGRP